MKEVDTALYSGSKANMFYIESLSGRCEGDEVAVANPMLPALEFLLGEKIGDFVAEVPFNGFHASKGRWMPQWGVKVSMRCHEAEGFLDGLAADFRRHVF